MSYPAKVRRRAGRRLCGAERGWQLEPREHRRGSDQAGGGLFLAILLSVAFTACATVQRTTPPLPAEQEAFWSSLQALCGRAYEGRVLYSAGNPADTAFASQRQVMHVRECSATEIRIPFHVGDDRSRTWVLTRTATGLRLKHDHRHEDGQPDSITMYGGDTRDRGDRARQVFPADAHTISLNPVYSTNVWTIDLRPGQTFTYELQRVGTIRRFAAQFDLTREVAVPPAPWGAR
jgi:hypothetical protein